MKKTITEGGDMAEPVEIEILGHKAKITSIKAHLANPPFSIKDSLSVWIDFDEPVDGTSGFGTTIPVKYYGKEELLETIRMNAENDLKVMMDSDRKQKEKEEQRKTREKDLNDLGEQFIQMLTK